MKLTLQLLKISCNKVHVVKSYILKCSVLFLGYMLSVDFPLRYNNSLNLEQEILHSFVTRTHQNNAITTNNMTKCVDPQQHGFFFEVNKNILGWLLPNNLQLSCKHSISIPTSSRFWIRVVRASNSCCFCSSSCWTS